jgi:multimeric flavodoxin WrbA
MNILAINGSPRDGNTEFMLGIIRDPSSNFEEIKLRNRKIDFCGAEDNSCSVRDKCIKKDDMDNIYRKLEEADIIILASPCYFSNVTALMKRFMDRCNPYYYNKKLSGKKFFLLSVGGHEQSIIEAIRAMKNFLKGIFAKSMGEYYAVADKKGELEGNQKVIKELQNIGKKLKENAGR